MSEKRTLYGIYSEKQRQISESLIYFSGPANVPTRSRSCFEYTTPDGRTVTCTQVGDDPEFKDVLFDDKQFLGEVVEFVRAW